MNALIVGGAGFIGSQLSDYLLRSGDSVTVVDNLMRGNVKNLENSLRSPSFTFEKIDANDTAALAQIIQDRHIDIVYHLAANSDILASSTSPYIEFTSTAETTWSVLAAMRQTGVKKLFFSSSSAIYGEASEPLSEDTPHLYPISYYGGAKLASEAFIKSFSYMNDFQSLIFRFPNVIGPRLTHGVIFDFINQLKEHPDELVVMGNGNQNKPYLHSSDLVNAIISFSKENSKRLEVFNIGVETSTSVKTIVDIVLDEMGLTNTTKVKYGVSKSGWKGDVSRFQFDLHKIHETGWEASMSSDEAVRLTVREALGKIK